jgi:hypothetical protein
VEEIQLGGSGSASERLILLPSRYPHDDSAATYGNGSAGFRVGTVRKWQFLYLIAQGAAQH